MLKELNRDQAQFVAMLAKSARMQHDAFITRVPEDELGETKPSRGEHNPTAALGFAAFPEDAPQVAALREAIETLSSAGRAELYALMRVGKGELAVQNGIEGLSKRRVLATRPLRPYWSKILTFTIIS